MARRSHGAHLLAISPGAGGLSELGLQLGFSGKGVRAEAGMQLLEAATMRRLLDGG